MYFSKYKSLTIKLFPWGLEDVMKSKLISILFSLRKGDAHPCHLTKDVLEGVGLHGDASLEEVMTHYRLVVQYIPELGEHEDSDILEAQITKLEIIYNGFTPFDNPMGRDTDGMFETGDVSQPFNGRISPVLRFTFDREVEEEAALRSLESTCFQFMTPAMDDAGDVYELSDHNGWNEVLDEDSECAIMDALIEQGLIRYDEDDDLFYYPKLTFESGMDTYGHVIDWPKWHSLED